MSRATKSGFAKEAQEKMNAKFDPKLERQAIDWMEAVSGTKIQGTLAQALHDGIFLCRLMNKLKPGCIPEGKISSSKLAFKQMENINIFLNAMKNYGVPMHDSFQTIDLFEAAEGAGNIVQVIDAIHALGRAAQKQGFRGPTLGAKVADAAPRQFSEETLKAGQNVIGLQAGFAQGANQSGVNFGNTRHI